MPSKKLGAQKKLPDPSDPESEPFVWDVWLLVAVAVLSTLLAFVVLS